MNVYLKKKKTVFLFKYLNILQRHRKLFIKLIFSRIEFSILSTVILLSNSFGTFKFGDDVITTILYFFEKNFKYKMNVLFNPSSSIFG